MLCWLPGWLRKPDIEISQSDEKTVNIIGMLRLPAKLGVMNRAHKLYATHICLETILGAKWLR